VIDPSDIYVKIFKINQNETTSVSSNLKSVGINSSNILLNLGVFLLAIVFILAVVGVALLLRFLARKYKM
jgi:hypothetical protein